MQNPYVYNIQIVIYSNTSLQQNFDFFLCELFIRLSIVLCADCIVLFHFVYDDICEWKMDIEDWSGWWLLVWILNCENHSRTHHLLLATDMHQTMDMVHGQSDHSNPFFHNTICFILFSVQWKAMYKAHFKIDS